MPVQQSKEGAAAPAIRLNQLNSGSLGDIANSVNLYRGDVNFPFDILGLTGRNGMDVKLTAFYESNVQQFVQTWNMDAPTGTLGVGWSIPFEKIMVDGQNTGNNEDDHFYLLSGGNIISLVHTGGSGEVLFFEMAAERFWKIAYYPNAEEPQKERWEITREDGTLYIYGVADAIEWRIKWKNWIGSTTNPNGTLFPGAWCLSEVRNRWGDSVLFSYESDLVPLGSGSAASYTRAIRLKKITDVFAQTVTFFYANKDAFEIQLPEMPPAPGAPNAYQFLYETKFLDYIEVKSEQDVLLFTVLFKYKMFNVAAYPNNTNDYYKKRYLESVIQQNVHGNSLPGIRFLYYENKDDIHPGALYKISYPEGGEVTYEYETHELLNSSTRTIIRRPGGSTAVPGVWYGPDYVVVTWVNREEKQFDMSVCTWGGQWTAWEDTRQWSVEADTLRVYASVDFFVIVFKDSITATYKTYVFRNDIYRSGYWNRSPFQPEPEYDTDQLVLAAGADYFAMAGQKGKGIDIYQWNASLNEWNNHYFETGSSGIWSLAAGKDYLLSAGYNTEEQQLTASLYYVNDRQSWKAGDTYTKTVEIDAELTKPENLLSIGVSWTTLTYITNVENTLLRYSMLLLQWDGYFHFYTPLEYDWQQDSGVANPVVFTQIGGDLVGNSQHFFRYNGSKWIQPDNDPPVSDGGLYRYAYGMDLAIQLEKMGDSQLYRVYQYDPYTGDWKKTAETEGPVAAEDVCYLPSISDRYSTVGDNLYYRNAQLQWEQIATLPSDAALETLQNRAPAYLSYQSKDGTGSYLLFVKDGQVVKQSAPLAGENCFVKNAGPGQLLAGLYALATYKGDDFSKTAAITLYRVINESLADDQVAWSVSRIGINDGYTNRDTFYKYDRATATYDPYSRIAQYTTVKVYPGSDSGENGYTEQVYFNGLNPDAQGVDYPLPDAYNNVLNYFSLFNGQLYRTATFDAAGKRVAAVTNFLFAFTPSNTAQLTSGAYTRLCKTEERMLLYAFELDKQYEQELENGKFTEGMRRLFAESGFTLSGDVLVQPGSTAALWLITEVGSGESFTAALEGQALSIYAEVVNATLYTYNAKGQNSKTILTNWNTAGEQQQITREAKYGWEVYPGMLEQNLLVPIVQTSELCDDTIRTITVSTFIDQWVQQPVPVTGWVAHKTLLWDGTPGTAVFDFDKWSGRADPAEGWLKTMQVLAVSGKGIPLETADVDGIRSASLYDKDMRQLVCTFNNASLLEQQAAYYGFEPYEDPGIWKLYPSSLPADQYINTGDCFTGSRRLVLPGQPQQRTGLLGTLSPAAANKQYVLSCYIKTAAGFDESGVQAGWEITLTDQTGTQKVIDVPVSATGETWQFFYYLLDLEKEGMDQPASISLLLYNQQDQQYLLADNICFLPFGSNAEAGVYDLVYRSPVAVLSVPNQVQRHVYDQFRRVVAGIGKNDQPKLLSLSWLWKQGMDQFNPLQPSYSMATTVRTGGHYVDFLHGNEWQHHWEATGDWGIEHFRLLYKGSGEGTLTLAETGEWQNAGLRFKMDPTASMGKRVGIRVGTAVTIQWENGSWQLLDEAGGVLATVPQPVMNTRDWCLMTSAGAVLFFADGQQVFSHLFENSICGLPVIFTEDPLAIEYLISYTDPLTVLTYQDNISKSIQSQALDNNAVLATASLYDHLGRDAIKTKTARFENTLFAYRPSLVAGVDWTTGVMTGEVAEQHPGDEGYPYSRTLYEDAPLSRVLENGLSGKEFGIDLTVSPAYRHTTMNRLATNTTDAGITLPAGKFILTTEVDPDKMLVCQVIDFAGNTIAALSGSVAGSYALTVNELDVYGNITRTFLPDYFQEDLPGHERFVETYKYDFWGRVIEKTATNQSAPSMFMYDDAGRIRFMQDANGVAAGYILYWLYDPTGRLIEKGSCDYGWDERVFKAHVNEKDWLPVTGRWSNRYQYDGDGTDYRLAGRLWKTSSRNEGEAEELAVEEIFSYNDEGYADSKTIVVPAFDEGVQHTSKYSYDNMGNTTAIIYNAGAVSDTFAVLYHYNALAEMEKVDWQSGAGDEVTTESLSSYAYNTEGALQTEKFNPGTSTALTRDYEYNPAGWLSAVRGQYFSETLQFTQGGYEGVGYYNGRIAAVASSFEGLAHAGDFPVSFAWQYQYNELARLAVASNNIKKEWSLGLNQPLTYDKNGNITRLNRGDGEDQYNYYAGTDQLSSTQARPGENYTYNGNGNVCQASPRGITAIEYTRMSQMTVRMEYDALQGKSVVHFNYDGNHNRVLKTAEQESSLYVLSLKGRPIMEITRSNDGTLETAFLIWGQSGLFAIKKETGTFYLLKDHQNSTRAVWNGTKIVSAFNYLPLGDFMGQAYMVDPSAFVPDYLYTGQELDTATGLYNYKARFYDPFVGRFYATDPAAQFASPYVYAGNDPINFTDPSGYWSWGAFGAILGGIAAIVGGVVLTVVTAGAATPVLVAATIGGGALIGAGVASTVYGATHTAEGSFSVKDWGVMIGLGAAFGAFSGGVGLALDGLSAGAAIAAETVLGTGSGSLDGFISNGTLNAIHGRNFMEGAGAAAGWGALFGGVSGALGGVLGRGIAYHNNKLLKGLANKYGGVEASVVNKKAFGVAHAVVGVRSNRANPSRYFDHVITEGDTNVSSLLRGGQATELNEFVDFQPARGNTWTATLDVSTNGARSARQFANGRLGSSAGPYNLLTNSCSTNAINIIEQTGLRAPVWARTPTTLYWWIRSLGGKVKTA